MTTMTPEAVQAHRDAAAKQYDAAMVTLGLSALHLLATDVRADLPNARRIHTEWSDLGSYLTVMSIDAGDDDEDYDWYDEYGRGYDLEESNESVWAPFATEGLHGLQRVFDIDRLLTEVPAVLAAHLAKAGADQ